MKITEIEIDNGQTGHYIQIFTSNQKQAISLRLQTFDDQTIKDRSKNEIAKNQNIISHSSNKMEITIHNFLISTSLFIFESESES